MDKILLVAADWQFRTLVHAQLLEEGYEVKALPSLAVALASLMRGGETPRLVILDAQGEEIDIRMLRDLGRLVGDAPLILCGGALDRQTLVEAGVPAARVLLRPFAVGDIIQEVRQVLA